MNCANSRIRLAAGLVLAVFLALATAWAFYIPLGGGIDEPRHLRYVQIVAEEGRLPTPAEKQEAISHHPPLHYVIAAPVYLVTKQMGREAAWHALRLLSVAIGAGTVLLVFAMLRRMLPDRPWAAVAGMAFVAFLPHFQMISAFLSNDVTSAFFCTLMLYFVVRLIRSPEDMLRWSLLAGLAAGLAVLTRTNAMALIPVGLAAVLVAPLVPRGDGPPQGSGANDEVEPEGLSPGSRSLRATIAFGGAFALTGGLWLARHVAIWGGIDPDPPWPEYTWPVHTFVSKFLRAAEGLFRSWWAQVGWIPGPNSAPPPGASSLWPRPDLETPVFAIAVVVSLVAAIGVVVLLSRWLRDADLRDRGLGLATFVAAWLLTTGGVTYNAVFINPGRAEGGRYAMPAVAAVMSLLALGPLALPRRWRIVAWAATGLLLTAMTAISFWEMHTYLIPTFAP